MQKITLCVLAGVILIAPAAASAPTVGMGAAVQSAASSTSSLVVLAGDCGQTPSNTSRSSARSGVAAPNAKIRTPQQCLRACRRLKGASPDFCVASCL
jgi:hypothetical protein